MAPGLCRGFHRWPAMARETPSSGNSLSRPLNVGPALDIMSLLSRQEVPFKEETGLGTAKVRAGPGTLDCAHKISQ